MKSWNWPCSHLGIVTDYFLFSDFKLGPKKGMLSTLYLLFNRTELFEGLSVDANFHPQPHSMSDYNVLPVF